MPIQGRSASAARATGAGVCAGAAAAATTTGAVVAALARSARALLPVLLSLRFASNHASLRASSGHWTTQWLPLWHASHGVVGGVAKRSAPLREREEGDEVAAAA